MRPELNAFRQTVAAHLGPIPRPTTCRQTPRSIHPSCCCPGWRSRAAGAVVGGAEPMLLVKCLMMVDGGLCEPPSPVLAQRWAFGSTSQPRTPPSAIVRRCPRSFSPGKGIRNRGGMERWRREGRTEKGRRGLDKAAPSLCSTAAVRGQRFIWMSVSGEGDLQHTA